MLWEGMEKQEDRTVHLQDLLGKAVSPSYLATTLLTSATLLHVSYPPDKLTLVALTRLAACTNTVKVAWCAEAVLGKIGRAHV